MTLWYYRNLGDYDHGPMSGKALLDCIHRGEVLETTLIRKDDSNWVPANQINGLWNAALKPTKRYRCEACHSIIEKPPTRCPGCDENVLHASVEVIEHVTKDQDPNHAFRDTHFQNRVQQKSKTTADVNERGQTIEHQIHQTATENAEIRKWVGDLLDARKKQRTPPRRRRRNP